MYCKELKIRNAELAFFLKISKLGQHWKGKRSLIIERDARTNERTKRNETNERNERKKQTCKDS